MVNLVTGRHAPAQFTTSRLSIERYQEGDKAGLFAAARESVATVYPWLPWCHSDYQQAEAADWITLSKNLWQRGEAYSFAIKDRNAGTLLGGCGLNQLDEHQGANLGYWLRTSACGRGLATEATIGLAQWAFTHLPLRRLEIVMAVTNNASRQVAISAGAHFEGELRNRLFLHGKAHNAYLYSLLPGETPTAVQPHPT